MMPYKNIIICIISFFLSSCTPKHIVPTPLVQIDQGRALFLKAEKLFEKNAYNPALSSYQEYLSLFSNELFVPAALMKIGAIHMILGNHFEARASFNRLINTFPKSLFAVDARIEILFTYFNEGDYTTVILEAQQLLQKQIDKNNLLKVYVLLGDAYAASDLFIKSIYYYSRAYIYSSEPNRKIIIDKLKEPAANLNTNEIQSCLNIIDDKLSQGYFLYLIGISKAWYERYEEALFILSEFIEDFPQHKSITKAKMLIREIESKSNYKHTTIGCLLPLTGSYKTYGNKALMGIEFALHQFLSQHANMSADLIVKDTESDNNRAVEAVRELYKEKVAAIIGPVFTSRAAALEAQRLGIPIITITQQIGIADTGKYVFRNFFTPEMQIKTIVSYAFEELGLERFAILYPDDNYGNTFMDLFWDEIVAYGGKLVGIESYRPDQTDFADSIKKLVGLYHVVPEYLEQETFSDKEDEDVGYGKDREPEAIVDFDAIFIPDDPKRVGLIIPQLAYYDVNNIYLFGTNLWHSSELIKMARQYVQGAIMPDVFFAGSTLKQVKNFVSSYENMFQEKPGFIEAVAYDTAMILCDMVNRPDISFRTTLISELGRLKEYNGVTGLTSFDSNGEVDKKLYLLKIHGTNFKEVE